MHTNVLILFEEF